MRFIDEVELKLLAGQGGHGCMSFRREKFVPLGGPDGGDGGKGGDIVFVADSQLSTLMDLRYLQNLRAKNGQSGLGKQMTGANAEDLLVRVPVGTIVYNAETGEKLGELLKEDERIIAAKGGRGGKGNMRFATPTQRAPRKKEEGRPGEEIIVRLELKLLADVGLVGFPSVGKSTLIAAISAARPKIADYPFTTLVPNLGVVKAKGGGSFVMADLPGLIEGAHDGQGLGHQFLRHIERCAVLVHLVEFNEERGGDPFADYRALVDELRKYNEALLEKPQIAVLNKVDLNPDAMLVKALKKRFEKEGMRFFAISAATHAGLEALVETMASYTKKEETIIPSVF